MHSWRFEWATFSTSMQKTLLRCVLWLIVFLLSAENDWAEATSKLQSESDSLVLNWPSSNLLIEDFDWLDFSTSEASLINSLSLRTCRSCQLNGNENYGELCQFKTKLYPVVVIIASAGWLSTKQMFKFILRSSTKRKIRDPCARASITNRLRRLLSVFVKKRCLSKLDYVAPVFRRNWMHAETDITGWKI